MSPVVALRVVPFLAQQSVAIEGGADMDDRAAMDDGDVNDPLRTPTVLANRLRVVKTLGYP
jgi:hypothetical protein